MKLIKRLGIALALGAMVVLIGITPATKAEPAAAATDLLYKVIIEDQTTSGYWQLSASMAEWNNKTDAWFVFGKCPSLMNPVRTKGVDCYRVREYAVNAWCTTGCTGGVTHQESGIYGGTIDLYIFKDTIGWPATRKKFMSLHELGHAGGISGHAPQGPYVMAPKSTGQPPILTAYDRAAINIFWQ